MLNNKDKKEINAHRSSGRHFTRTRCGLKQLRPEISVNQLCPVLKKKVCGETYPPPNVANYQENYSCEPTL